MANIMRLGSGRTKSSLGMYLHTTSLNGVSEVIDTGNNKIKKFLATGYLRCGIAYGDRHPIIIQESDNNSSWSNLRDYNITGDGANKPINEVITTSKRYFRIKGDTVNGYTSGCSIGFTVIEEDGKVAG